MGFRIHYFASPGHIFVLISSSSFEIVYLSFCKKLDSRLRAPGNGLFIAIVNRWIESKTFCQKALNLNILSC